MKRIALAMLVFPAFASFVSGQAPPAESPPAAPAPAEGAAPAEAAEPPEAPPLPTRITAVTLYSDQALVMRQGSADLAAGRSRLEVSGLPAGLRDEAVRARVVGGGARLANLEVLVRHKTVFKKKEAEEAERRLKEIQARHRAVADALGALEREAALLRGLEVGKRPDGRPEKPTPAPLDVAAWDATLKFVDAALAANRRRARELLVEADGIEEEMAVAADQARKLASRKVRSEKSVVLELESAAAGRAELEIAYLVPGPGWWPRYDLRADVDRGKIEMQSFALVRQETGEDWDGVELTFSAAEPARAADLPELASWRIGEAKEPVQAAAASSVPQRRQPQVRQGFFASTIDAEGAEGQQAAQDGSATVLAQIAEQAENKQVTVADLANPARNLPAGQAQQTREILGKLAKQRESNDRALERGQWDEFVLGNKALKEEIQNLSPRFKSYYREEVLGCDDNIARGEKLLKTRRLAEGIVPPVRSSRGYDYKYRALRAETIPSDGAFNKVVIGVEEFPAEFVYEAAPEERELAFLTTRIRNARRQPYLEGPASVFLSSDFIGDGRVPTTARGEEFPVDLGADESVSIRRRQDRKRETTGLFTSWHRYLHEVEITVKNQKARAVRVAVVDRLPFSEDPKVEVERKDAEPRPAREDRKGLYRWEFTLDPGREEKIAFAYTVKLPADRRLVASPDATVKW